eukprot:CAMPEP_0116579078 /NCGR_PEP_ID=MMETSP0397-20121206/22061_1 /TAXON_ID=216820 /ORGANISM="Cyclophora tenuis, Strain ECT3854" /LENGTH=87 /DNA_ID=CAMNT_0004108537 /DNA_START=21 /DNA_END=284 /DNA_ORIENTATION=-
MTVFALVNKDDLARVFEAISGIVQQQPTSVSLQSGTGNTSSSTSTFRGNLGNPEIGLSLGAVRQYTAVVKNISITLVSTRPPNKANA